MRILVAMGNRLSCAALTALLSQEDDLEVVAQVLRLDEVATAAERLAPDLAVLDLDLGSDPEDGLSMAFRLCRARTPVLVLAETCHHGVLDEARKLGILTSFGDSDMGGIGFLTPGVSAQRLVSAIRDLVDDKPVIDPELVMAAVRAPDSPLTPRECEVLSLTAGGAPVSEIARSLGVSVGTVHNHLSRITCKMGARTRIEAVKVANDAGWL